MNDTADSKAEPKLPEAIKCPTRLANGKVILFYQHDHISALASEQGNLRIAWAQEVPMAQFEPTHAISFLKVDNNNSALSASASWNKYTPYGYLKQDQSAAFLAFNGELLDTATEAYALGNGYRLYNPALLRFHSPDDLSPFDRGGLNCYGYCEGDSINNVDPTGHSILRSMIKGLKNIGGRKSQKLGRIAGYNSDVRKYNTAMNRYSARPNINQDGSINLNNLLSNSQAYNSKKLPAPPKMLSDKTIAYAAKHHQSIESIDPGNHFKDTIKLELKHAGALGRLELKLHNMVMQEETPPQNPINTTKSMWNVRQDRDKWSHNN